MARPRGAKQRSRRSCSSGWRASIRATPRRCARCVHDSPFQLLVATILSAQTTDEMVNKVTPALFARYPTPADLAHADPGDVEVLIHPTGFFRQKTKSIIGMAQALEERFDGEVPTELDDLVTLPGCRPQDRQRRFGRWRSGCPACRSTRTSLRLTRRLKLTNETDPVKVELDLNGIVPPEERGALSLRLILHGRRICIARKPRCAECLLVDICPSAAP